MKRRLRIAVSVFFALVAVAFAVLWVRSYRIVDIVWWQATATKVLVVTATPGQLSFEMNPGPADPSIGYFHCSATDLKGPFRWLLGVDDIEYGFALPIGFLAMVAVAFSTWTFWSSRFSLRALLTATTLVAVVLGLIVFATRAQKSRQ